MDLLFYAADSRSRRHEMIANPSWNLEIWKPSWRRIVPRGLSFFPFAIWWLLHYARVFHNRQYALVLIRDGDRVIHRSTIVPCYFRFPFMNSSDVQVGVWTEPAYRGHGLAVLALEAAVELVTGTAGRVWYIVRRENRASVRVAENAGLMFVGQGKRVPRFGLRALGKFVLEACVFPEERAGGYRAKHRDPVHS